MKTIQNNLDQCKLGDTVNRYLSTIPTPMKLVITQITEDRIICGDWKFDKTTGAELDEMLGWSAHYSGSYIIFELENQNKS